MVQIAPQIPAEHPVEITELFPDGKLQRLQDMYARANHVGMILTNLDGTPLLTASNIPQVCQAFQATEKGREYCRLNARLLNNRLSLSTKPVCHECLGCGFVEAGVPVMVGDRHIANWVIGFTNANRISRQRVE